MRFCQNQDSRDYRIFRIFPARLWLASASSRIRLGGISGCGEKRNLGECNPENPAKGAGLANQTTAPPKSGKKRERQIPSPFIFIGEGWDGRAAREHAPARETVSAPPSFRRLQSAPSGLSAAAFRGSAGCPPAPSRTRLLAAPLRFAAGSACWGFVVRVSPTTARSRFRASVQGE